MPAADLHPMEEARLAALHSYGILDTPREQDFDEIVEILAAVCDAPISVVNLVDAGRQWFKAETGLGVRETPIESSLCAHAILQKGTMMVPDTRKDPRFCDNPLVMGGPQLRFYAGALLESPEGLPLGTLCVLDYRPRRLDEGQLRMIGLLAKQVVAQMNLRRALRAEVLARETAETALEERTLMAQEIDHRVKNSLQMVSGMLQMQARRSPDPAVSAQLLEAERRVRSIAIVHEQLYQAGSLSGVDVCDFVNSLCAAIGETRPAGVEISSHCDTGMVSPEQAAALGLLINELVANAFKHGFPNGKAGRVHVSLDVEDDGLVLSVEDDGRGFEPAAAGEGLGSRLIRAFTERLEGSLHMDADGAGTRAIIRFPQSSLPARGHA